MVDHKLVKAPHPFDSSPGVAYYEVHAGDRRVGFVYSYFPEIEKKIKGERFVAWRRKAKAVQWKAETSARPGRPVKCRTRAEAVSHVLAALNPDT